MAPKMPVSFGMLIKSPTLVTYKCVFASYTGKEQNIEGSQIGDRETNTIQL